MDYIIWWILLFAFFLALDFLIFRRKRKDKDKK